MVHFNFPHPDLENSQHFLTWQKDFSNKEAIHNWLTNHLAPHESPNNIPDKCWYSEAPLHEPRSRDLEHFRPKGRADVLGATNIAKIESIYPIKVNQIQNKDAGNPGYSWLEFDYLNFRQMGSKINGIGYKGTCFPIFKNTTRLAYGTALTQPITEFPLLLDPTERGIEDFFVVYGNGEIHPAVPLPQGMQDYSNLTYTSDLTRYARAAISIVVYGLNEIGFIKPRKKQFKDVCKVINSFSNATIDKFEFESRLLDLMSVQATYAFAGRCAAREMVSGLPLESPCRIIIEKVLASI